MKARIARLLSMALGLVLAVPLFGGPVAAADWNVAFVHGIPGGGYRDFCVDGRYLDVWGFGGVVKASLPPGSHRVAFRVHSRSAKRACRGRPVAWTDFSVGLAESVTLVMGFPPNVNAPGIMTLHLPTPTGETLDHLTVWNAGRHRAAITIGIDSVLTPSAEPPTFPPGATWRGTFGEPLTISLTAFSFLNGEIPDRPTAEATYLTRTGRGHLVVLLGGARFRMLSRPNLPVILS